MIGRMRESAATAPSAGCELSARRTRPTIPKHASTPEPPPIRTLTLRAAANERGLTDYVHLWAGQAASLATSRAAADYLAARVRQTRLLLDLDA